MRPEAEFRPPDHERLSKILDDPGNLDAFLRSLRGLRSLNDALPSRVNADPESIERGLARLVLTLIDLLRQLM